MGKTCYVCKGKLGRFEVGHVLEEYEKYDFPIPEGLSNQDWVCNKCYDPLDRKRKDKEDILKYKASADSRLFASQIEKRVPEFKAIWDKGGVVQFKDKNCAILHRFMGQQVQFIIAFSDLTKEGYRLMVIDEGKEASAGGISGGVSSYYYFQKMEFVR